LKKLYDSKGIMAKTKSSPTARIGERSSHTWFVLKYLLGFHQVRNYDGSWTEWGNLIAPPSSTKPAPPSPRWPPLLVRPFLVSQASAVLWLS